MAGVCCMHSRLIHRAALGGVLYRRWLSSGKDSLSTASNERVPTTTHVTVNDTVCHTPKEANTGPEAAEEAAGQTLLPPRLACQVLDREREDAASAKRWSALCVQEKERR
ncbi:hypothetical protein GBAR_LOCUS31813, partial [Geodia barretti]